MKLTASQQAKRVGLDSLSQVSRMTGKSRGTLYGWHKKEPELFNIVLLGCSLLSKDNN